MKFGGSFNLEKNVLPYISNLMAFFVGGLKRPIIVKFRNFYIK